MRKNFTEHHNRGLGRTLGERLCSRA